MDITLSFNNFAESLTLPIPPKDFVIPANVRANEEFELIGSVNGVSKLLLPGHRELKAVTIDSFFPMRKYSFAKVQKNGLECVNVINKWANKRTPIRIIVTEKKQEILNMACLIDNFTYGFDKAGDIKYTLALREFIFPVMK
ncbi:hypothetical protein SAMN05444162_3458 [Paenibacillaceae bacterium GAS479]|nr:hypothetical protein SAMN05444162_3458 [Paenibacillaceae bacterium GAS479]